MDIIRLTPLKCPLCPQTINIEQSNFVNAKYVQLEQHVLREHKRLLEFIFQCSICITTFKSHFGLLHHYNNDCNVTMTCFQCSKTFHCRPDYQKHFQEGWKCKFPEVSCDVCPNHAPSSIAARVAWCRPGVLGVCGGRRLPHG